jgi:hypothetical protein
MFAQRLICSWIGAVGLASGAFCQIYVQFSVIEGTTTAPRSINEKGEIAGTYFNFAGSRHGFVRYPNGTITTFDVPGSLFGTTGASSINDKGAITGTFSTEAPLSHGFIRDPCTLSFVPPGTVSWKAPVEHLHRRGQ